MEDLDNIFGRDDEDYRRSIYGRDGHRIVRQGNIGWVDMEKLLRDPKTSMIGSLCFWQSKLLGTSFSHYEN